MSVVSQWALPSGAAVWWKDGEHTCFLKSFWRGRVIFLPFLMQALLVECVENPFKQHEVEAGFWTAPHTYVHPHNRMFCYSRGCLAQYFSPRPWFKWSCITSLKGPSKEKPDEFTEATPIWQKPPPYSQTTRNPGTECAFFCFVLHILTFSAQPCCFAMNVSYLQNSAILWRRAHIVPHID